MRFAAPQIRKPLGPALSPTGDRPAVQPKDARRTPKTHDKCEIGTHYAGTEAVDPPQGKLQAPR